MEPKIAHYKDTPFHENWRDCQDYYEVLSPKETGGLTVCYQFMKSRMEPHVHQHFDEIYLVDQGSGTLLVNGEERMMNPGEMIWIPRGTSHGVVPGADGLRVWAISYFDEKAKEEICLQEGTSL